MMMRMTDKDSVNEWERKGNILHVSKAVIHAVNELTDVRTHHVVDVLGGLLSIVRLK